MRLKFVVVPGVLGSVVDVSSHPASSLFDRRPVVFTAHSAGSAYLRQRICAYVLNEGAIPINPWMVGGYFLYGLVDKDAVRRANNNLLMRSDELWVSDPPATASMSRSPGRSRTTFQCGGSILIITARPSHRSALNPAPTDPPASGKAAHPAALSRAFATWRSSGGHASLPRAKSKEGR